MSDQSIRIEPQYLLAAAQSSIGYYQAIWQKMGLVLAIQLGGITATYGLHLSRGGIFVMIAAFFFSCGPLLAAEYDIRNRSGLLAQVDQIARAFGTPAEQIPGITLELEPFKMDRLFPASRLGHTGWLLMRIAVLLLLDIAAVVFIRRIS
ncbi:hypothetical protein ABIB99_008984 [Bradyrhizobium sp. LA6.1]|uniref:hypothetical protein n=1 Tax=Bradyrhizobium sp. LA6.1 TaxID=3156378 RepID=UPI00339674E7